MHQGVGLQQDRSIRVVCLEGDKTLTPAGQLSDVLTGNWELPHLAIDSKGSPWLFLRHMSSRQPDSPGTIYWPRWELSCTRYDGSRWGELMFVPHSSGRKNMRPSSALDSDGRLWAVWPTDNRSHQVLPAAARSDPGGPLRKPVRKLGAGLEGLPAGAIAAI